MSLHAVRSMLDRVGRRGRREFARIRPGRRKEPRPRPKAKAKAEAAARKDAEPRLPPTHADVAYAPHELTKLDFWKAEGEGPRPLMVHIHGGGWVAGDKKIGAGVVKPFLDKGISLPLSTTD